MRPSGIRLGQEGDVEGLIALATRNGMDASHEQIYAEFADQRQSATGDDMPLGLRLVAEWDGAIVATGLARSSVFTPTGWYVVQVHVDLDFRRRGIGSALLRTLEDAVTFRGGFGIESRVPATLNDARRWAHSRGFQHLLDELTCVLDLDHSRAYSYAACEAVEGLSFRSMADLGGRSALSKLSNVGVALLADIPEMQAGGRPKTDAMARFLSERVRIVPEATWIAAEGERWVGTTVNAKYGHLEVATWPRPVT